MHWGEIACAQDACGRPRRSPARSSGRANHRGRSHAKFAICHQEPKDLANRRYMPCRSCATLVYRGSNMLCRATPMSPPPWVPRILQNHASRSPEESSRIRSALTALDQGSEVLFPRIRPLCAWTCHRLCGSESCSGRDLHGRVILLPFSHTVSFFWTLGAPGDGTCLGVGAFDALHASFGVACTLMVIGVP